MTDLNTGSKICSNCGQNINIVNFLIHEAFCLKNFIKCHICNKSFNKNLKNEHFEEFHSKIECICGSMIDKYLFEFHQTEICSKRQIICSYCDISLDYEKINEHKVACGSRTELCEKCRKYVLIKDKLNHEMSNCLKADNRSRNNIFTRHELKSLSRPTSSLSIFPCEFCNKQFVGFQELFKHQVSCESNYPDDHQPNEVFNNFVDHMNQEMENISTYSNENKILDEINQSSDLSLVPCEFCSDYIDFDQYNEHLQICNNIPNNSVEYSNQPRGSSNLRNEYTTNSRIFPRRERFTLNSQWKLSKDDKKK